MTLLLLSLAFAQDDGGSTLTIDPNSIDLSGPAGDEVTYEGKISQTDPSYTKGKAVTVSHSNGNLEVRCMDTDKLTARLAYTVYGTSEPAMESAGKAMGLKAGYGAVASHVSGKSSGVSRVEADMTVNVPMGASSLTITHSGTGWVRALDCGGALKISAGAGGLYANGTYTSVVATANGGDLKIVMDKDAVLTGSTSLAAPQGNATLKISPAQGGKVNAKGGEVSVQNAVLGTNTPTLVSGDMGVSGPTITMSSKNRTEISNND